MKAFFHRLHIGGGAKDKDRDASLAKEKFPPLPSWPPPQDSPRPVSAATTPVSIASFKPLPDVSPAQLSSQLSSRPLPPIASSPSPSQPDLQSNASASTPTQALSNLPSDEISQESSAHNAESTGRSSRKTNGSTNASALTDVQKKVAFISPPQSPVEFERDLPEPAGSVVKDPTSIPLKTTVSRFQAVYGKEPRTSVSSAASSSKVDVATTTKSTTTKATSTRTASPYLQKSVESAQSLRSGTPYSQLSNNNTSGSRILAATSWSEVTEDDLVSNLGMRERTRQEVLFEIISSEERYVATLYTCVMNRAHSSFQ